MDTTSQMGENHPPVRDWAMIVDDDHAVWALVTEQFMALDIEAVAAARGDTALRFAVERDTPPLIVLIDVMIPGMDCLRLAARLQERFKRHTKVVILSRSVERPMTWPPEVCDLALLPKPFSIAELLALVKEARATRRGGS